jgi:hypothetical protein
MGKMKETPLILVVNPESELRRSIRSYLRGAFGETPVFTTYSRPFNEPHPRMRPHEEPRFRLVLIDVSQWVTGLTAQQILAGPGLPPWIRQDLLDVLDDALVVIFTPEHAYQGVVAVVKPLPGSPAVLPLGNRSNQPPMSEILRSMWDLWKERMDAARPVRPEDGRARLQRVVRFFTIR